MTRKKIEMRAKIELKMEMTVCKREYHQNLDNSHNRHRHYHHKPPESFGLLFDLLCIEWGFVDTQQWHSYYPHY